MTTRKNRKLLIGSAIAALLIVGTVLILPSLLTGIGRFLVVNTAPEGTDAAVVLSTGVDYYPRLMQAASLYKRGLVHNVVVNGNRKTDALRELEAMGFKMPYPWSEQAKRILVILGVPRKHVIAISAENAYDTVSEAQRVGDALAALGINASPSPPASPIHEGHCESGATFIAINSMLSRLPVQQRIHLIRLPGGKAVGRLGGCWRNMAPGSITSGNTRVWWNQSSRIK